MKKIFSIMLSFLLLCGMSGCANKNKPSQENNTDKTSQENTTDKNESSDNVTSNNGSSNKGDNKDDAKYASSEALFKDFYVQMDGKKLPLPFDFSEIEYSVPPIDELIKKPALNTIRYSDSISYFWNTKNGNGNTIILSVFNPDSSKKITLEESMIYAIQIGENLNGTIDFAFPKNITFDSTHEDIIKAYGRPVTMNTFSDGKIEMVYRTKNGLYELTLYFDHGTNLTEFYVKYDYAQMNKK